MPGQLFANGWVVLTKDKQIRRRTLELKALTEAGVAAFVLTAGNLRGEEMGLRCGVCTSFSGIFRRHLLPPCRLRVE